MASNISWDETGKKFYETGIDHGVLFPTDANGAYTDGVAWNGLTGVTEKPSGAEANPVYADNIKYLNLVSLEQYGATLEAFTYPDEFAACDGSADLGTASGVTIGQQGRKTFGLSYRTRIGNDVDGDSKGYKIHLVYGALAAPSEKAYATVNDSPEAITFSWEITTTPVAVTGKKPTSSLVIDSTKITAPHLTALETILYGIAADPEAEPPVVAVKARLPLPDEIITLLAA